jgi:hypothetical protein
MVGDITCLDRQEGGQLRKEPTSMTDAVPDGTILGSTPGPTDAERATATLVSTGPLTISAMPIVVSYFATIPRVRQVTRSGELVFVTTRWVDGTETAEESWEEALRDAYRVRDEFLKVSTEREALDFLRETGEFLPSGDPISWLHFKRW